jgi:hypothetical protein
MARYINTDCCEGTTHVDQLLARYQQERNMVVAMMSSDPDTLIKVLWKDDSPLGIDNSCRCQMGAGEPRSPLSCAQCTNMKRLVRFNKTGPGTSFLIECGRELGRKLIFTISPPVVLSLRWAPESDQRARLLLASHQALLSCGTPPFNGRRITGDVFTITTLVSWLVEATLKKYNINVVRRLTAFVCRNTGYSVEDSPDLGLIDKTSTVSSYLTGATSAETGLKPEVVLGIITQLVVNLIALKEIRFSHGMPSDKALFFSRIPVSYIYQGFHVKAPLTLSLGNFSKSSAGTTENQFFSSTEDAQAFMERYPFSPEIQTIRGSMAYCGSGSESSGEKVCQAKNFSVYRLTADNMLLYTYIRHSGIPLFTGSFDFYCFLISLMRHPIFRQTMLRDQNLYRLWSLLWLPDDFQTINERLGFQSGNIVAEDYKVCSKKSSSGSEPCPANTADPFSHLNRVSSVDYLKGLWLRCDALEFAWDIIRKI